jgi:dTDP-4-amino-4,6-dideoxygalactose transaminase
MGNKDFTRRRFMAAASAGSFAASSAWAVPRYRPMTGDAGKLAILGGKPVRANKTWPKWPYWDDRVIDSIVETTKSRIWCRIQSDSGTVPRWEEEFARLMETGYCVATGSGTQALHTCVEALGIGPGDEVITSPYTDPGTISSIISARALPVLADLDRESYQLDPDDVERRVNENTRAIMPVHIMGQPADMSSIMAIARKHNLKVIEDAAQAHLSVYRGHKLGTIGDVGCFSFQSSKTIACGEGGAVIGNNEKLMDRCYTVHNHGTSRRGITEVIGPKYRMNELEAALLLGQLSGVQERFVRRNENAAYLTKRLKDFPGVAPQKLYEGTESGSYYIYAMTYKKEHFNDTDRDTFLKAVAAEGVTLGGYIKSGLHTQPWTDHILSSRVYQKMYSDKRLLQYRDELNCPTCDKVCQEMAIIWASGPLLADKNDMDDVVNAIMKVHENRDQLSKI